MSEIFLDTETTGLSVAEGDRIVEIACVETQDLIPTKKIFHKILNPEKKISQEAFKVHGFSDDFLKDKEKFKDIADEFLAFIKGKKLIIHNAPFDIGFLNSELKKINKQTLNLKEAEDTLNLARTKYPASSNSLDNLCKRFNIDLSKRTKHNALLDCELLREVYINLVGEKEPSLIFKDNEVLSDDKNTYEKSNLNREKIIIKLSDEDIRNHSVFLKSELKKNFF
tara:strand:+ start:831 stop:1505 length:675 start_codon:yes stop_codon:yes gene_type:complete